MSKHTPEPWAFDDRPDIDTNFYSDDATGSIIGGCQEYTFAHRDIEERRANARRIVTCVNACAGMADPAAEIAELKRQRDELMVALNKYEEAFDGLFGRCGSNGVFNHWGGRIDCSTLNEAHELSSNATKGPAS